MRRAVSCIVLTFGVATASFGQTHPLAYEQALDLIHAYSGSGTEIDHAMQLAEGLLRSHPNSGYAQTLAAEAMSTWRLDQSGRPVELRQQVIALCDEALRINPGLAQAHVAKGRALLRASMYEAATASIDAALALDPKLAGAMFLRAEFFRRSGILPSAQEWYQNFIEATPSKGRKSNGYYWIGKMYEDAAAEDTHNRSILTAKARQSYERMLSLEPDGAWRNINFAIFLNGYAADFAEAERYAQVALGMMEFPMARYHLAAARYQTIWADSTGMSRTAMASAAKQVATSTGVTLSQAMLFRPFSAVVRGRLEQLQARLVAPQ